MYRILVTGKSSFIGRAFQARCADFPDRYRVDAISLRGSAWRAADFSGYDAVVHAAGIAHVRARDAMEGAYMAVNRDLAVDVAQKAKAAGVSQFLFLSSMLVYGSPAPAGKSRVIDARTAPAPENAYARSKLFAEEGIRALEGDGFRAAILRPPMVYGKGCRGNYQTLAIWARRLPLFPNIE
ncbi:MAG: NAD-dependent epimerase/dehydratase family protein, partial [Christensenellales bacterium]